MTPATADRLEWVCRLGTKAHLAGQVPQHDGEAIDAMEKLLAAPPDQKPRVTRDRAQPSAARTVTCRRRPQ